MASTIEKFKDDIIHLIRNNIQLDQPKQFNSDPFWQNLRNAGTEIWLDTGDLDQASEIWTNEMSALTTNNTLLNKEIQKGIYDEQIKEADRILKDMDVSERVTEIAFILNARHGLKLVEKFGGKVSVELHTNLAHNLNGIIEYGQRFHEIDPDHFIIKVPYTATGLLGARKLVENKVPVNLTLGFSARQNALAASVVNPDYLNVFLGRLNAYVADNELGDGQFVGEKATLASQKIVHKLTKTKPVATKQIAASMRSGKQMELLAGIDVFTVPPKVAQEGKKELSGEFVSRENVEYPINIADSVDLSSTRIEKLWDFSEKERKFAKILNKEIPKSGEELEIMAQDMECEDMFPKLSGESLQKIASDGKIPKHARWARKIKENEIAIDTLLNIAGLASFAQDQEALDQRITEIIR